MRFFTKTFFVLAITLSSFLLASEPFPSSSELELLGWLVNITKQHAVKPEAGKTQKHLDVSAAQQWLVAQSLLLNKVAGDQEALRLIKEVYVGLQGEEGEYLRQMLVLAASDKAERDSFIRGVQYEKGLITWPGCDLAWEKLWGSPKVSFGSSKLKQDINALEARLFPNRQPPDWLKDLTVDDLDAYEPQFKLFLRLEPKSIDLMAFLIRYLQSWFSSANTLEDSLKQLNHFLLDNENGAMAILEEAKPRNQLNELSR